MSSQTYNPTHDQVAKLLHLTVATVSRLRSGDRFPSIWTMKTINDLLDWSLDAQSDARAGRTWTTEFNSRLTKEHGNKGLPSA